MRSGVKGAAPRPPSGAPPSGPPPPVRIPGGPPPSGPPPPFPGSQGRRAGGRWRDDDRGRGRRGSPDARDAPAPSAGRHRKSSAPPPKAAPFRRSTWELTYRLTCSGHNETLGLDFDRQDSSDRPVIREVLRDTAADKAGVPADSTILSACGHKVHSLSHLQANLAEWRRRARDGNVELLLRVPTIEVEIPGRPAGVPVGLEYSQGRVRKVHEGSLAERAGIEPNMSVILMNGIRVSTSNQYLLKNEASSLRPLRIVLAPRSTGSRRSASRTSPRRAKRGRSPSDSSRQDSRRPRDTRRSRSRDRDRRRPRQSSIERGRGRPPPPLPTKGGFPPRRRRSSSRSSDRGVHEPAYQARSRSRPQRPPPPSAEPPPSSRGVPAAEAECMQPVPPTSHHEYWTEERKLLVRKMWTIAERQPEVLKSRLQRIVAEMMQQGKTVEQMEIAFCRQNTLWRAVKRRELQQKYDQVVDENKKLRDIAGKNEQIIADTLDRHMTLLGEKLRQVGIDEKFADDTWRSNLVKSVSKQIETAKAAVTASENARHGGEILTPEMKEAFDAVQERCRSLFRELTQTRRAYDATTDRLADVQKESQRLSSVVDKLHKANSKLESKLVKFQEVGQRRDKLEADFRRQQADSAHLLELHRKELEALRNEYNDRIDSIISDQKDPVEENASLSLQLQETGLQLARSNHRLREAEDEILQKNEELVKLQERSQKELERAVAEVEKSQAVQGTITGLRQENESLKADLALRGADVEELNEQLVALRKGRDFDDLERELAEHSAQALDHSSDLYKAMKARIAELESDSSRLRKAEAMSRKDFSVEIGIVKERYEKELQASKTKLTEVMQANQSLLDQSKKLYKDMEEVDRRWRRDFDNRVQEIQDELMKQGAEERRTAERLAAIRARSAAQRDHEEEVKRIQNAHLEKVALLEQQRSEEATAAQFRIDAEVGEMELYFRELEEKYHAEGTKRQEVEKETEELKGRLRSQERETVQRETELKRRHERVVSKLEEKYRKLTQEKTALSQRVRRRRESTAASIESEREKDDGGEEHTAKESHPTSRRLKVYQEENERLRGRLREAQTLIGDSLAQSRAQREKLRDAEMQIEKQENRQRARDREGRVLQSEVTELKKILDKHRDKQVESEKAMRQQLNSERDKFKKEIRDLEQQLRLKGDENEWVVKELRMEKDDMVRELEATQSRRREGRTERERSLRRELESTQEAMAKVVDTVKRLEAQRSDDEGRIADMKEALEEQSKRLTVLRRRREKDIRDAVRRAGVRGEEVDKSLLATLQDSDESTRRRCDELEKEVRQLQSDLESRTHEVDSLKQEQNSNEQALDRIARARDSLKVNLEKAHDRADSLKSQLREAVEDKRRCKEDLVHCSEDLDRARERAVASEDKASQLSVDLHDLHQKFESAQTSLRLREAEAHELRAEVEQQREDERTYDSLMQHTSAHSSQALESISEGRKRVRELEDGAAEQRREFLREIGKLREANRREIESHSAKIAELTKINQQLQDENRQFYRKRREAEERLRHDNDGRLQNLQEELTKKGAEADRAAELITELRARGAAHKERIATLEREYDETVRKLRSEAVDTSVGHEGDVGKYDTELKDLELKYSQERDLREKQEQELVELRGKLGSAEKNAEEMERDVHEREMERRQAFDAQLVELQGEHRQLLHEKAELQARLRRRRQATVERQREEGEASERKERVLHTENERLRGIQQEVRGLLNEALRDIQRLKREQADLEDQVNRQRRKLHERDTDLRSKQTQIDELSKMISETQKKYEKEEEVMREGFHKVIDGLRKTNRQLEQQVRLKGEENQWRIKDLEQELEDTRTELKETARKVGRGKDSKELRQLREENADLSKSVEQLEGTCRELNARMRTADDEHAHDMDTLRRKMEKRLHAEKEAAERRVRRQLEQDEPERRLLDALRERESADQEKLERLDKELRAKTVAAARSQDRLEELQRALEDSEESVRELTAERKQTQAQLTSALQNAEDEVETLRDELRTSKSDIRAIRGDLKRESARRQEAEQARQAAERALREGQGATKEESSVKRLEHERKDLKEKVSEGTEGAERLAADVDSLTAQKSALERERQELEDRATNAERLLLRALQQDSSDSEAAQRQLEEAREERAQLVKRFRAVLKSLKPKQEQFDSMDAKVVSLRNELADARRTAEESVHAMRERIREAAAGIKDAENTFRKQKRAMKRTIVDLEEELHEWKDRQRLSASEVARMHRAMHEEHLKYQTQLQWWQAQVQTFMVPAATVAAEDNKRLTAQNGFLSEQVRKLEYRREMTAAEVESLAAKLERLQKLSAEEQEVLESRVDSLTGWCSMLARERDGLRELVLGCPDLRASEQASRVLQLRDPEDPEADGWLWNAQAFSLQELFASSLPDDISVAAIAKMTPGEIHRLLSSAHLLSKSAMKISKKKDVTILDLQTEVADAHTRLLARFRNAHRKGRSRNAAVEDFSRDVYQYLRPRIYETCRDLLERTHKSSAKWAQRMGKLGADIAAVTALVNLQEEQLATVGGAAGQGLGPPPTAQSPQRGRSESSTRARRRSTSEPAGRREREGRPGPPRRRSPHKRPRSASPGQQSPARRRPRQKSPLRRRGSRSSSSSSHSRGRRSKRGRSADTDADSRRPRRRVSQRRSRSRASH
eukprot:TRINITY_DN1855_c1_g1_i1.p1 TRINITY_DN1855_c1_g1~~TRINITY_DN1855_c1_g1_i1.p1  ORF type:complete len:2750 (+),score=1072.93 TRINITY_DN1855_c1_g1_i1:251-8251(+)